MRPTRGDVRDHINSHKRSWTFETVLQRLSAARGELKIDFHEIFEASRFDFFNSIVQKREHLLSARGRSAFPRTFHSAHSVKD